ncbi:hypothetical protein [Paenibacillus sp. 1P07SE]|uniref:hypothetical protein n=1 Tax=Paenibacillus sp. 1P07SE TaxID=3132209 RepID=UPI0039A6C117
MANTEAEEREPDKPSWSWRRRLVWGIAGLAVFAAVIVGGSYWYVSTLSPEEVIARVDKSPEIAEAEDEEELPPEEDDEPETADHLAPGGDGVPTDGVPPDPDPATLTDQETSTDNKGPAAAEQAAEPSAPAQQEPAKTEPPAPPDSGSSKPPTPPEPPAQPDHAAAKAGIDAKYDGQLQALQSSCTAKTQALVGQIVGELKGDSNLQSIQSNYLGQVASAEAGCDSQFQSILSQAQADYQQAGIPASQMPGWQSAYESAKAAARASALSSILNAVSE